MQGQSGIAVLACDKKWPVCAICSNHASNNPFLKKKQAYKDSGIKLTQELLKLPQFKFKNVEQRSSELAKIAVELWPLP